MRSWIGKAVAGAACAALVCAAGFAQQYPSRPLRIIVPFPPSGGTDIVARLISQKLAESLGQTVVVDNRPGAGANIGIGLAAKAPPDGYTILIVSSAFTVNPTLYAKPPYDAHKDFQPLTCVGSSANALAVTPSFPAKGFKELVALVRSQPGKHNYSSPGAGTTPHLSGEMFRLAFKLDLSHVPYAGGGPQVLSLIGGQVPIGFASLPTFAQQIKAGQLRGLAVTADKRASAMPDIPSTAELGAPELTGDTFQGVFVPSGVSKDIQARLHRDILKALAAPDVRERLITLGFEPIANTPEAFAAQVRGDIERWGKVIRAANIKPN